MERYDLEHPASDMPLIKKPPARYTYHGNTHGSLWNRVQKILKIGLINDSVRETKSYRASKTTEDVNTVIRKWWNSRLKHNIAPTGLCIYSTPDPERAARYASSCLIDLDNKNPEDPNERMSFVTAASLEHTTPLFQIDTSYTDPNWWGKDLLGTEYEQKVDQFYYVGMIPPEAIKLCFYDFFTGKIDRNPSKSKIEKYFKGFKKVKWDNFDNVDVDSFRESTGSSYRRSYFGL